MPSDSGFLSYISGPLRTTLGSLLGLEGEEVEEGVQVRDAVVRYESFASALSAFVSAQEDGRTLQEVITRMIDVIPSKKYGQRHQDTSGLFRSVSTALALLQARG